MIKKLNSIIRGHLKLIQFGGLKVIGEAFVFLFPILIAKFVAPEIYGSYSLGMMIIFFATTLLLGSSMTPFIISSNKELKSDGGINKSISNQLIFFVISLLLIGILFLVFGSFIIDFIEIDYILLAFLYIAFIGISLKSLLGNYFWELIKK